MSKIDDGESAFPRPDWNGSWAGSYVFKGMSLRDWFAGQALMSMLSAPDKISDSTFEVAAGLSYQFADAMIKARKVKP
jgi:hypothetical protein